MDFIHTDIPQAHPQRAREILATHPEVRELFGRNPWSVLLVLGLVSFQLALAFVLRDAWWLWVVLLAYGVGAFVNHALFVCNHESAHDLILPKRWQDLVLGIVGDVALAFPSAVGFRRFHLVHHASMGQYDLDGDIATRGEARLVGHSWWRKAIWVALLGVSQALRPLRLKGVRARDRAWVVANFVVIIAIDIAIVVLVGPWSLVYLALSTVFALGLHPVGGRWIQEHFVTRPGQETYSYYGPLNAVALNVGYHNEHHDFAGIPWNRLPRLTQLAPEQYDSLAPYRSWSGLLVRFVRDPSLTLYSRMTRDARATRSG
ncbi:MAG: fatty acid desaturase [Acidimicrobiia bacterium]|jgi:sphingolipid delta-4 desaturase